VRRQIGRADVDNCPAVGQTGVVMNDEQPIRGTTNIELDSVAAQLSSQVEGVDRVLTTGV